jgi:hypothetical protein
MDHFMTTGRSHRLKEFLRHDGRRHLDNAVCSECNSNPIMYRCTTCFHAPELCRTCILKKHTEKPFCELQVRAVMDI